MKAVILILKGILMGIANIIPGVSGGTIAVVLRIFDEMIEAINNFYKSRDKFVKYVKFLVPLFLGALIGVGAFSKLIEFSLERFSLPTSMFFVGLVVGSIPLIYSKAKERELKPVYLISSVAAFLVVVAFSLLKEPDATGASLVLTPFVFIKLLLCGLIASAAMVVPGISGSFVMVLLGVYTRFVTAISDFLDEIRLLITNIGELGLFESVGHLFSSESFFIISAMGIGVVLGILIISKIIEILLKRFYSWTYFAILGLIFGSVFSIFKDPLTYQSYSGHIGIMPIAAGLIAFAVGAVISLLLGKE